MNTDSDNISTYLGQKGYTIYKDALEMNDQEGIRNELMAKPFVPKSSLIKPPPNITIPQGLKKDYTKNFMNLSRKTNNKNSGKFF